jgi:hypothetical protein
LSWIFPIACNGNKPQVLLMSEKHEYLCCFDWGNSGSWFLVTARSQDQVQRAVNATVFADKPAWMTDTVRRQFVAMARRAGHVWDMDDEAPECLHYFMARYPFAPLNPTLVADFLKAAGFSYPPTSIKLESHEERLLARLPDQRLAWFALSPQGQEQLRMERRVLRLLEARCKFAAPRIIFERPDERYDVRTLVPGIADAESVYNAMRADCRLARAIGESIGAILAEQHTRIHAQDVAEWLPQKPAWPEPRSRISERLPQVVDDPELIARADKVIQAYESIVIEDDDRALVHTDIGFHNLAIDAASFTVNGVYDYIAAAWADRHHDFRYLVLDFDGDELLEGACAAYQAGGGRLIRRDRVLHYNAACAITFLAFRVGHAPEERWCGRTLAEDLQWCRHAIDKLVKQELL